MIFDECALTLTKEMEQRLKRSLTDEETKFLKWLEHKKSEHETVMG